MLVAIERALNDGYAVAVLNPNTNSVWMHEKSMRVPIPNSFSPEVCFTFKLFDIHSLRTMSCMFGIAL